MALAGDRTVRRVGDMAPDPFAPVGEALAADRPARGASKQWQIMSYSRTRDRAPPLPRVSDHLVAGAGILAMHGCART